MYGYPTPEEEAAAKAWVDRGEQLLAESLAVEKAEQAQRRRECGAA